ncbi:dCTP deaminase [Patescibacteria group bacterium]|jgi:dCTP deaminase|nr:dCTP deaminase [Candidatus Dojkabacteria bacterium]CAG1022301.1 dCTP deaminase [Patescibacteria group bacterium]
MIISDKTLKRLIKSGELVVDPLTDESIQPASIDCRLGDTFLEIDNSEMSTISMSEEIKYRKIVKDKIAIPSHSFVLATTVEYIELPDNITAFVEGRSSIGRMGLFIQNAGWVDPGFKGKVTLELYNANSLPIVLEKNRRICQFVFCYMDQKADKPYLGKYQGQLDTVGSRVFKDSESKFRALKKARK